MRRRYSLYAKDILTAVDKIRKKTSKMSYGDFIRDDIVVDGVIRNLEIIGECVGNLPEEAKLRHPEIPWSRIRNFRNIAVHKYWSVDVETVWDICQNRLDELQETTKMVLKEIETEE